MKQKHIIKNDAGFGHTLLLVGLVCLLAIVLVGYKVAKQSKPAATGKLQAITLQLNWINNAQFAGLYTAVEKGYYKQLGLDVKIKELPNNADSLQELADNHADFAVTTPLEVVQARDKGKTVKAIAAIHQTSPYVIASRKDANIKSPADFKGKVLGAAGGNPQAAITYNGLLLNAGLQTSDVRIASVDYDAVKVLKDHTADTVDIYRTDQTYLLQ